MMKAIDILGPREGEGGKRKHSSTHDNPCHTTYEAVEQRPPLNPILATVAARRGIG
jgi:hypothetical protein